MEAHRTALRVVTEAVNDQFCCLLYLATLLKMNITSSFYSPPHPPLQVEGGGGRSGGKGEEVGPRNGLLVYTTSRVLVMTPLKIGTHVNVLGKGTKVM